MISTRWPLRATPMVPNAIPVSQMASAQPVTRFCTCSGRASVVKSRSMPGLPNAASRTLPPTRYRSKPAESKSAPSSESSFLCRFKVTAAVANSSAVGIDSGTSGQPTGAYRRSSQ
ncbi:Uncharacterised protein [Mycobacteroides abscessus subsp. abscessus]|nr:Uncharacterised protein [Mycobacteroides abscessus subsp. abscessus]